MTGDRKLLEEYASGSEGAFREIVARYVDLVYSVALRLVNGDTHAAQDVAQTVFIDLAQNARSISKKVQIGGWLHRHTCFVAAKLMRSQRRRTAREKQAANMNEREEAVGFSDAAQLVDAAINQLGATDRTAIVLRFFDGLDFRAVGAALGTNESAAQKRVSRALEKLHRMLAKKGVTLSIGALTMGLTMQAVSAAPVGLAASISKSALLAAPHGVSLISLIKAMTISKGQIAIAGLVVIATITAPVLLNRDASRNVTQLEQAVNEQMGRLNELSRGNRRLVSQLEGIEQTAAREKAELMQLSGEADALRAEGERAKELRAQIQELSLQREGGNYSTWKNAELWHIKKKRAHEWWTAFRAYADAHGGQLPKTFEEAETYLPKDAAKSDVRASEEYEILYSGTMQALTNVNPEVEFLLFREKKLTPMVHIFDGQYWNKMGRHGVLANGQCNFYSTPPGYLDSEFVDYEKEHLVSLGAQ